MKIHAWKEMEWEKVTDGISRKIITGENVMIAQIHLAKGAVVPEHSHLSEQMSYVIEGSLEFTMGGRTRVVTAGEVLVVPPHLPHKVIALEDTLSADIFSPIRQDWLDHTDTYFHQK
jgi:quercetin dioxygenase-like cupin family protein